MMAGDKPLTERLPHDSPPLSSEFRAIFDAEFGYVCRSLRRLGVSDTDTQDVAQELFVAVHRAFGEYDRSRPIRPWLFSFALRFASNHRRLARHRLVPTESVDDEVTRTNHEDKDLVLRALDRLDDDFRVAVVMHDLAGFSAPEIAETLNIPLNTVYSRIRLGRADLRATLERLGKGGTS